MSELAGPAQAFLDQAADALLVTAGSEVEPGKYSRVLVALADRGALREVTVPREVRSSTIGVWLDSATSALSFLPRPTPRGPSLTGIRSRAEDGGWLCVLRFDRPISVGVVVAELARQSVAGPTRVLPKSPVDLRVINPIGFDADASEPVVALSTLDLSRGVTEELVRSLRSALGVRIDTELDEAARLALSAAGVPLDLETIDRAAREERSIVAWRAAIDSIVPPPTQPSVSIVMATKRPEMLEHALAQVRQQRGVERLELVLAPHGFDPGDVPNATVVPQPESEVFGDVLNAAVSVASGDVVVKMDDDDWYAPDFVADLLRARAYSGADLVGTADEFYYLADRDLTVQRRHPGEFYTQWVAGGTLMLDRSLLAEVGGFAPVPRHVDRHLLDALLAVGAVIYRMHGLGYVLRRTAEGHTYDADLDKILDPEQVVATWDGFRPSRLHQI